MNSIKTNTKNFVKTEDIKCIAQIMAVAEKGGFRLYVAWEWEEPAKKGVFGFTKSDKLYNTFSWEDVKNVASRGWDISGTGEEKRIFANLFITR